MKLALFADVHGRLGLMLHLMRNWQLVHASQLDAALIAGDLGCFPDPSKFDRATKRWVERDSEEGGFSKFFTSPLAEVERLFEGEFGVQCPVLFVPGNHEDYDYIIATGAQSAARNAPQNTFPVGCYKRVHCVRDGAIVEIHGQDNARLRITGIWGIENARAGAPYKIKTDAVQHGKKSFDVLLTHDAPAEAYSHGGSALITKVIRSCQPSIHLFGHVHPIGGTHEFSLPDCPTKSFVLENVVFGTRGRDGLNGSMGLLDWDGSTAKVEIVRESWLSQMRPGNWELFTPQRLPDAHA